MTAKQTGGAGKKTILFVISIAVAIALLPIGFIYVVPALKSSAGSSYPADGDLLNFDRLHARGEIQPGREFALVTGDSITMGYRLKSFRQAYPYIVDSLFREAGSSGGPLRVAVTKGGNTLNESYTVANMVGKSQSTRTKLKLVVVGFCLNDAETERQTKEGRNLGFTLSRAEWMRRFDADLLSFYRTPPATVEEGFKNLAQLSSENGFHVLIVIFPVFKSLDKYPFASVHRQVAGMALARGFDVIDLLPVYRNLPEEALSAKPGDDMFHPSRLAHKLAADAIFIHAVSRGWVTGLDLKKLESETGETGHGGATDFIGKLTDGNKGGKIGPELMREKKDFTDNIRVWCPEGRPGGEYLYFAPPYSGGVVVSRSRKTYLSASDCRVRSKTP